MPYPTDTREAVAYSRGADTASPGQSACSPRMLWPVTSGRHQLERGQKLCSHMPACGIHMAAIWFNHIATILMLHNSHMTKSYDCHMDVIRKTYGKTIWLLYGFHMVGIWQSQMPAVWYAYGLYMAKPYSCHINTIQEAYGFAHRNRITKPYACHVASIWQLYGPAI